MAPEDLKQKPDMLNALTSFRFIAALMVFLWHIHIFPDVMDKFQLGYAGVGFFYILSGFILTYVYLSKLSRGNLNAIKKFYIARVAKIYPTHILTLIAAIPLYVGSVRLLFPEHTTWHFLGLFAINLSLLQSYFPSNTINFSFNGVAWSISVEMFFYVLFPLIIYFFARYGSRLTVKYLFLIILGIWLALMLVMAPIDSFVDDWRLYIQPIVRLPEFVVGIILGLIYVKQQRDKTNVISKNRGTVYESLSILALIIAIFTSQYIPQSLHFAAWLLPFWAIIVFVFSQQYGRLSQVLSFRPLVYLGEISFSFYMVHQLVIRYVDFLSLSQVGAGIVSLLSAIGISAILYRFYEEPSRIRVKKWLEYWIIYRRHSRRQLVGQDSTDAI